MAVQESFYVDDYLTGADSVKLPSCNGSNTVSYLKEDFYCTRVQTVLRHVHDKVTIVSQKNEEAVASLASLVVTLLLPGFYVSRDTAT